MTTKGRPPDKGGGAKRRGVSDSIGVIGLGIMGSAMAANLARAGYRVHGYDIVAARRAALKKAGWSAAVRKVLSTASNTPAFRATPDTAAMSVSFSVGLAGVSMKISLVRGSMAASTAATSEVSTKLARTPTPSRT